MTSPSPFAAVSGDWHDDGYIAFVQNEQTLLWAIRAGVFCSRGFPAGSRSAASRVIVGLMGSLVFERWGM